MKTSTARKIAQLPSEHLLIGVDVHKSHHVAVVMDRAGKVVARAKVPNNKEGFDKLLALGSQQALRVGAVGVTFGIEAGSHFWVTLAHYLHEREVGFWLVSPFTLKRRREGDDLTRRKNDYRDAEMAAELVRTGHYTETKLLQGEWAELRYTHSTYQRLVKDRTIHLNLLRSRLDLLFGEFCRVFRDPCGQTAQAVLRSGAIPSLIASSSIEEFVALVREHFGGTRLHLQKLRELHRQAGESVGVKEGARALAQQVRQLVEQLCLYDQQIAEVKQQLRELLYRLPEAQYLLSIKGLGEQVVAGLLAETGPFERYEHARNLIKLAGTDPIQTQSGNKERRHTPMSKKGRTGLRCVGWRAAMRLLRDNEDFRVWAERMRTRVGHPLRRGEILGAAINRLFKLMFALVRDRRHYEVRAKEAVAVAA